uniref:Apple domain-containing protein n=1 Tax=Tetradesmus obliquus TaxID=3088 RepID=A0A383W4V9_TETOB|eukprot:jgi/Sobl393_1/1100/SZX72054.1
MKPFHTSSSQGIGLGNVKPQQVITIAVCLATIVTLVSLNELQTLIASSDKAADHAAYLPTHGDWRTVEQIAERAVQHVEHLPTRTHHGNSVFAVNAGTEKDQQAGQQQTIKQQQILKPKPATEVMKESSDYPPAPKECNAMEFTELWGDVVKWGSSFHTNTPGECCEACLKHTPAKHSAHKCNVWVWCGIKESCGGQYRECWLKHLVHPRATKPAREGPEVGWTSGIVGPDAEEHGTDEQDPADKKVRKFHIITTAQGDLVHWQTRVHYYWYLKQKEECDKSPTCEMGGFTRLLHSGTPDDLVDEIPTFVAQPLPESVVPHEYYPVLNRPYALLQWVQQAKITEEYVMMSEPDHIFLRPLPNFMKKDDRPAAFPFFYIEPHKDENIPIIAKFVPGGSLSRSDAETIAPMGNSPTFLSMTQMKQVIPLWQNMSVAIFKDKEANEKWGWVQEMYAFTVSLFVIGVRHVDLILHMMAQPPWDSRMAMGPGRPYYILHYTYGNDYNAEGKHTPGKFGFWRFDKRTYAKPPPRRLGDPPDKMQNDMVRALISHINEATENIPCWDEYYKTGQIAATCDEKLPNSIYPTAKRHQP